MKEIQKIKNKFKLLLKDDTKKVINEIELSINYESKFCDELVIFDNRLARLNKENRLQTISYDHYNLGINRIQQGILEIINELKVEDLKIVEKKEVEVEKNTFEMIADGEFKGKNGEYKLTIAPTVFFSSRLEKAFPGIRGLKWFKGDKAIKRLSLLLREPTRFDIANGYGLYPNPIYWFRGGSALSIKKFRILSHGKCLLNYQELKISRIAAYNSSSYYRSFVYVETEADQPIGLYDHTKKYIENVVQQRGYCDEEYGLFGEIPIRREEFDDGAAEINGEVVDTCGAELRKRYLTKYNFIIVAKSSPFNSRKGNILGNEFMNEILKGNKTLEEFIERADELEKNYMDQ